LDIRYEQVFERAMKKSDLKSANVELLLDEYATAAISHQNATDAGDYKTANKAANALSSLYLELKRRGEGDRRLLIRLIDNEHPAVRLWAASHCLDFAPREAEVTLRTLMELGQFIGFTAETTLREWHAGRLKVT
jgi:hypothetical protein